MGAERGLGSHGLVIEQSYSYVLFFASAGLRRAIVERVCFRVFDNKRLGGVRQDDRSECLFTASRPYCVCIEKFTRVAKNKIVVVFTFNVLLTFY